MAGAPLSNRTIAQRVQALFLVRVLLPAGFLFGAAAAVVPGFDVGVLRLARLRFAIAS